MKISRTVSFGIGVVATLVLGTGTAVAATGGTFLLGKSNSASTPTSLTNSSGTALVLNSKSGTSPLKVNSTTKATNLNSDQLDGLDSTKFALATGQTNSVVAYGEAVDTDEDGLADTIFAIAECPAGTRLTGGGGEDYTADGLLYVNSSLDKTSWFAATTADVATADPTDLIVTAICYNPRGAVSGGFFRAEAPSASTFELAKEKIAAKQR